MSLTWAIVVFSASWVGWVYLGYPALLLLLRALAPRPVRRADIAPSLSVVIAVHNGGHELRRKLEETLALAYPGPREILVSSDGSTDDTEAVAREFEGRGVTLIGNRERGGKEAAQAAAIARAHGEVLVFTDVSASLEPGALKALVRPFADPSVGCVSSVDVVASTGGEGLYVRYEMGVRALESEAATLIGLSGSCFAARRALCDPWPTHLASDFRTALEAARRGLRAVDEPEAKVRFGTARSAADEFPRKVRTVRRGLAVLSSYRDLLSPARGRVALALWSHKVARFTSPFALLLLFGASAVLATEGPLGRVIFGAQAALYGLGLLALVLRPVAAFLPARVAAFFLLVNASMVVAWGHHLSGRRAVLWQPTRR